jgi:hypothetical protein
MDSLLPSYDMTPDGQRILVVSSLVEKLPSRITVVVNWDTGLKRQSMDGLVNSYEVPFSN